MKKPQFVNNEVYHIYNRGVEKRNIFLDDIDYFRIIHDLFEFNDEDPVLNTGFFFNRSTTNTNTKIENQERKPRKLLVEILAFSLMPNHFHLLIRQKNEKGIIRFMQKLGTGYTNYFNQKYQRVGSLFQGRFKAIHVNKQEYLEYLLHYIHFNCLDLLNLEGQENKFSNYEKISAFLKEYRWSSYLDYIGNKNFPSITHREFLLTILGGEQNYKTDTEKWLKEINEKSKTEEFKKIRLE